MPRGPASDDHRKRGLRWRSRVSGGGTTLVPGCLTSESEERETWTAGSLRAASSREGAAGRDFGGTRFRSHHGSRKRSAVTDLVKRCDQPVQVLIQPESLILAQSERWRQA